RDRLAEGRRAFGQRARRGDDHDHRRHAHAYDDERDRAGRRVRVHRPTGRLVRRHVRPARLCDPRRPGRGTGRVRRHPGRRTDRPRGTGLMRTIAFPEVVDVRPGDSGVISVSITNTTPVIDAYRVQVFGLDPEWVTVTPARVSL